MNKLQALLIQTIAEVDANIDRLKRFKAKKYKVILHKLKDDRGMLSDLLFGTVVCSTCGRGGDQYCVVLDEHGEVKRFIPDLEKMHKPRIRNLEELGFDIYGAEK